MIRLDRACGAYLGLAVGDALGATVEFMTPGEIRARHGEHRDLTGGGWLKLRPGQVTDDTEMALAMGAAILESGGWNLAAIATRWADWLKARPIDVGNTCRRGLTRYLNDGSLEAPPSDGDAGNGALMRVLPAILYACRDDRRLSRYVIEQAHITHHHPLSDAAVIVCARQIAALLNAPPDPDILGQQRTLWRALRTQADALVARHPAFRFDRPPAQATGYIVDTLRVVFNAFFQTDSFEDCLILTVNQGGDADTTGAIAGMLAGAFYGIEAIPARWCNRLDPAVVQTLIAQTNALTDLGRER